MAKEMGQLAFDGVQVWEYPRLPLIDTNGADIAEASQELYGRTDISAEEIAAFEQQFLTDF